MSDKGGKTGSAEVEESVDELVAQAIKHGVSDIHLEPREDILLVRFRIDGTLKEANRLPKKYQSELVGSFKKRANLSSEFNLPQEGSFSESVGGRKYVFKVSSLPTIDGEKLVVKLYDQQGAFAGLSELGLWGDRLRKVERGAALKKGLILLCGPSGSGKSALASQLLDLISGASLSLATVEEMVEKRIKGANQVEIGPGFHLSYANALKSLGHQGSDVIYVEHLSDPDTVEIALELCLSGKLIIASVNAGDIFKALERLGHMGAKQSLVYSELKLVTGQRLVKKLCPDCLIHFAPSADYVQKLLKGLGLSESELKKIHEGEIVAEKEGLGAGLSLSSSPGAIKKLFRASEEGCKGCGYSGHKGRIGLFEVALHGEQALDKTGVASSIDSVNSLAADGLIKALRGIVSVEDVVKSLGER
ncbi:MAG TPA: ATPase, T2SS/T4P/T4SS family [Candidatus Sulfotelmatobacter sp.]|nr:ATPase, T2SS/T4P/T4SS family [Candidatus Sulfotelmatobacter sp.]